MKSLRLVGVSEAPTVFQSVWQWRKKSLNRLTGAGNAQNKEFPGTGNDPNKEVVRNLFSSLSIRPSVPACGLFRLS